ncbi:MAG: holo-ACP synthase [Phycisphaerae bacterium]|nr:holo-ACP synthase [Phycisphaerae bacterium]
MSILGHGIDLVECARIETIWRRHGQRFLERVLTEAERRRVTELANPVPYLAGRWAAKEAILKMIGTGWRGKISWTDMEILPDALGQPVVTLSGETAAIAAARGITRVLLTITHTKSNAAASAIGVGE